MYCHQCGEKILPEARFCPHCGSQVQNLAGETKELPTPHTLTVEEDATKLEEVAEPQENMNEVGQPQGQRKNLFGRLLPIFIPVLSLVLVLSGLSFYFFQEKKVNEDVLKLKESAEAIALEGDYGKAKELIEKAQAKRSHYSALQNDLEVINRSIEYQESLNLISEKIKKTEFDTASKELASLKEKTNGEQCPIFESFQKQIEDSEIKITVGAIKKDLNELTSVDELGGKLSVLATLPEKEASAVKQEIVNKIVQISTDEVESKLADKQFSEAFSTIDKGLQFAANNEKLLALRGRAEQDQQAFEQAEQKRIEQAMEAAAQEDLKNRTSAVELADFVVEVDEYGDLYVAGTVENVATTSINSITIYYSIYDTNGGYIDDGYTSVYPYYLDPGEVGSFEDVYYGVYQDVNVEIDNITWYLY